MKKFLEQFGKKYKPHLMKRASEACEGLTKWALAIFDYHFVYKEITPLREDLAKAEKQLEDATNELT